MSFISFDLILSDSCSFFRTNKYLNDVIKYIALKRPKQKKQCVGMLKVNEKNKIFSKNTHTYHDIW